MTLKRKRAKSPTSAIGLKPGEVLNRNCLMHNSSPWGWVGTEVTKAADITREHLWTVYGFRGTGDPICSNKYHEPTLERVPTSIQSSSEGQGEVIIISEDEGPECSKKVCKLNPDCVNYCGQHIWEDEASAKSNFMKYANLPYNPHNDSRSPGIPVGLKNLGATCYANASLQVWFRDLAFRQGVYRCEPSDEESLNKFMDSPIFQLQTTFAALQKCEFKVYNPTKLVESLQLRATEQQDAQEFSKLFMTHLDAEFKKQGDPAVRSLISDQFQGKQKYGTICSSCKYRSEQVAEFLELEVNFKNNSKLEDCIQTFLQSELLSGDNQYLCPQCEGLHDASRYIELQALPPVLHFSLLRFVYDFDSMERKKSKNTISFPTVLDMGQFMTRSTEHGQNGVSQQKQTDWYALRGILLHKGASAYHGHYEAQVFDEEAATWFQFNDEVVTKIHSLGDKSRPQNNSTKDSEAQAGTITENNHRKKSTKRTANRDEEEKKSQDPLPVPPIQTKLRVSSKDAYALIYARISGPCPPKTDPPPLVSKIVNGLNEEHKKLCDQFSHRERLVKECFENTRRTVQEIYRAWAIHSTHDENNAIVSQKGLESWLSQHAIRTALGSQPESAEKANGEEQPSGKEKFPSSIEIPVDEIICPHDKLDPNKVSQMKRINKTALEAIRTRTRCSFVPPFTRNDVCSTCVEAIFAERLFQSEHPKLVAEFDELNASGVDGFWISKLWLKDWRLPKPKMHRASGDDPGPDASPYAAHVKCAHGNLSLNVTTRQKISAKAAKFLAEIHPSWEPLSSHVEPCPICEADAHIHRENKKEDRRRAEEEKARLRTMFDYTQNGDMRLLENIPCAIVPSQFLRQWKHWLIRPTDVPRPPPIDNSQFICEHNGLVVDLNSTRDNNSSVLVVQRGDWDTLETLYPGSGPLLTVEKKVVDGSAEPKFVHDLHVCAECHQKRNSGWETTYVTIRLCNDTKPQVSEGHFDNVPNVSTSRKSRRLRQGRQNIEEKRLQITKSMTVKDLKVQIQSSMKISTICQRLFYQGTELEDNDTTISELRILANDVLQLCETETVTSETEDGPVKRQRKDDGVGFGGTLLGGGNLSSSRLDDEQDPCKACDVCTYNNPLEASACEMCTTPFQFT